MKTTTHIKNVPISQLLLDTQNPRLPETQANQRDAIRTMTKAQHDKIMSLAQHIVKNGINPTSLPIIIPTENNNEFCVLDGNRRVTAIKLLETPTLADGVLKSTELIKLKTLSKEFENNPISELTCTVFYDRDEADTWIQLIHRGQNDGAGLVQWDGQVSARYDARRTGKKSLALQVIDFIKQDEHLSQDTRKQINEGKFPITSLDRLLSTPYVRSKLGVDKQDSIIITFFPLEEVAKGLLRVVDDLGTGQITVSDIKKQDQRIDYINNFNSSELPDSSKKLHTALPLEGQIVTKKSSNHIKVKQSSKNRAMLIPKECKLSITDQNSHRINEIYLELKNVSVDNFPNACAVMLRVFIELSMDSYLTRNLNWSDHQLANSFLSQKLTSVANDLETKGIMSTAELEPIRKAATGQTLLVASIKSMHAFVHNRFYSPIPSELKITWDDIQLFIEKVWSN